LLLFGKRKGKREELREEPREELKEKLRAELKEEPREEPKGKNPDCYLLLRKCAGWAFPMPISSRHLAFQRKTCKHFNPARGATPYCGVAP